MHAAKRVEGVVRGAGDMRGAGGFFNIYSFKSSVLCVSVVC